AENILVQRTAPRQYRAVFVDLHSARLGVPISDRAVVQNLAQLNQWFRRHASIGDRLRFLRAYTRWRNEFEHALSHARHLDLSFRKLVRALADTADQHARQLWARRDRRAHRDGRYFGRVRVGGGWRALVYQRCKRPGDESRASQFVLKKDWWCRQLRDPLRWFADAASESCKDSHSAQVRRAVLDVDEDHRLPVILKRPLARNGWRRLRMLWVYSRAGRGWRMGNALLHRNLDTARPLAMLERRLGPLVLDSILVTEAIPGARDLETYLREEFDRHAPADWRRHKNALIESLARLLRRFEQRGFVHRDCKAGNILVAPQPAARVLWIDMDGVRLTQRASVSARLRALARLHVSLSEIPGLTRTDRVRFLRNYCARFGASSTCWRTLWHDVDEVARRRQEARQRRRQWKLSHYGRE
ncbi:MAG: hypothetical protein JXO22_10965, partial [Phycisphaerae bacterium]|nr:hypothetical protein [Phycisphaerae bacterium]